jgi:hypothetical protein
MIVVSSLRTRQVYGFRAFDFPLRQSWMYYCSQVFRQTFDARVDFRGLYT